MGDYRAVYSVGNAIVKLLADQYPPPELENQAVFNCTFRLVSSHDIAREDKQALNKVVSVFMHRITRNEQAQTTNRLPGHRDTKSSLVLDLHYLITYWGASAEAEQVILGWAMQQLESNPVLSVSTLSGPDSGPPEMVQLVPANLSLEDIHNIWNALGPKYRLSVAYVARSARIDSVVPDA